ncbi:alpha-hydroxy-acid oxidizing protein [Ramlibacter ginsenosidimutans]|uniref:Alpha-hydroxy-acid oxidizing protein n=1 Tax=Ramlibacter ginsenosidimutans TaxID=502333 RepID=A0A934TNX1_9BURK|nr:alpha-hydroxy-acid oxidizing protein [Ramlibacter ginsenosidimutans]
MVDSGFRRGSDVPKALALGADFVFVGRPFNYAATIAGAAGVAHAAKILAAEIDTNMGLLGINTLDELGAWHPVVRGTLPSLHGQASGRNTY